MIIYQNQRNQEKLYEKKRKLMFNMSKKAGPGHLLILVKDGQEELTETYPEVMTGKNTFTCLKGKMCIHKMKMVHHMTVPLVDLQTV